MTADVDKPQISILNLSDDPIVMGLKQLYDTVIDEPVPAEFLELLRQIDSSRGIQESQDTSQQTAATDSNVAGLKT